MHRSLLLCSLLAAAPFAFAQSPSFKLSGYGTLGAVHSSDDKADYVIDQFKPDGPGASHAWSGDVDSRLGAQLDASFGHQLSAVVQVIAQQRYDNSYQPTVEWANVKWQVTPDAALRAGRIVLPVFMVTDSRKVGYANAWVRPPVELYGMVPVTNSDGADASYRLRVGDAGNTVQAMFGRSKPKFPPQPGVGAGMADARDLFVAVYTLEYGNATVRTSYGRARLSIDVFDPLFGAYRQFGPAGAALADRYDVHDKLATFTGVGGSYDPGAWFAMAEWARFNTRSVVGAKNAWYVSGGYRVKKLTPYVTFARVRAESPTSDAGLPPEAFGPALASTVAALNAALNATLATTPEQSTWSIGLRWDVAPNAALKAQFDRVQRDNGSTGTFINFQPGFQPGGRADLFSIAVDFVF